MARGVVDCLEPPPLPLLLKYLVPEHNKMLAIFHTTKSYLQSSKNILSQIKTRVFHKIEHGTKMTKDV